MNEQVQTCFMQEGGIAMKNTYRRVIFILLILDICVICGLSWKALLDRIPDTMLTYVGKEEELFSKLPLTVEEDESLETWKVDGNETMVVTSKETGNYTIHVKLFGVFPLKTVQVKVIDEVFLSPSGEPIGIYVATNGLLVLGTASVEGKDGMLYDPATNIVKSGDYILKMNGEVVKTIKEFNASIQKARNEKMTIRIRRNDEEMDVAIKPVEVKDGTKKLGIWVREDTQGIGTMTYVGDNGIFGALGHGITDADTGTLMNLSGGELFHTEILDIVKGERGVPGELEGYINMVADNCIGTISKNTNLGIFGKLSPEYQQEEGEMRIPVGLRQDIRTAKATILSHIEGKVKEYEIEVEKINRNSVDNKGMIIHITDEKMLQLTGGIVQGMSGSPIIQDGKIIGAVTHVLVNDPTRGYGMNVL